EKPALLFWKMMNSYSIFGVSDWAARIPAAVHATAVVVGIFFFMRRFRFASELDAAMIAASSAGMIGFGRGASTDMLVSAPFALAMMCWWTWHQTPKKLWLLLFYGLLGIGALAKGPVAPALAVLVVGGYAVLRRDGKIFVRSLSVTGFLLFAAIVLPWYLAVQHKVPQFFRVFFIEHNLERFGTNLYQHSQPFWYYIPVFILAALPWTWFTITALVESIWTSIQRFRRKESFDEENSGFRLFLLVWIFVPIVFFSISRAKLPGYILPAVPGAAILTADFLHVRWEPLSVRFRWLPRLLIALHALLCAMLMVGALMAPFAMAKLAPPPALQIGMTVTGALIAVMVLLMVRREGVRVLHFVTLVPTILAVAFLLRPAAATIDRTQSARPVNQRLAELGVAASDPVASFNVKRQVAYGLDFYRNQPISHYEQEGPLDMPSGIPSGRHVVVAREGSLGAVQAVAGDREVKSIGTFPPQHLEFFVVSAAK
ncbi:MAG TPA: glycosyltransferase family 39 protein, partial [Candidatus Polarisedimenticolia bacterium]|nr:glycosyltransferase family 39 protein [Candidatus Polarisedimenticolia bacterium]